MREYERLGFLPPAERSTTGHRRYGQRHLDAILAARTMQAGYGWEAALLVMRSIHARDLEGALEMVDARHAAFHEGRRQVAETLDALRAAFTDAATVARRGHVGRGPLRVGEAARLAGVPVSAVRFWEQSGLLHPQRDRGNRYRLYDAEQLRRLRVTALLRQAGYGVPRIADVLGELSAGRPEKALAAVERRRAELAEKSRLCAAATAALWSYWQAGA